MKHFIVEITYLVPAAELGDTVAEHRAFLQTGYDLGWLLLSGPRNPKTGGMVVARAPELEALQQFFAQDPYLLKNLARHTYVEFDPVKRQSFMENWVAGE